MFKKHFLLFSMMLLVTAGFAQEALITNRVKADKDAAKKDFNVRELRKQISINSTSRDGDDEIIETVIFSEDFSKFTAGSIE